MHPLVVSSVLGTSLNLGVKTLSFGCFSFEISVPQSFESKFQRKIQKYIVTDCTSIDSCIQANFKDASDLSNTIVNGWSSDGIYFEKGVPHFSISCDSDSMSLVSCFKDNWSIYRLGIQYAMILALAKQNAVGFHGVTIICGDQVIILSAPSGTGKTTLANLLVKHTDGLVINGDFALLHPISDEGVIFEPTPFCGSSGICHNYRLRVNRIVFLEQAIGNSYRKLTPREGYARILSNSFVPEWDEERAAAVRETALKIVETVPMDCFAFEPTQEAAELFHSIVTKQ